MLSRHGFVRRERSPPTFVEKLLRLPPAQSDVVNVDHTLKLASYVASCLANSRFYVGRMRQVTGGQTTIPHSGSGLLSQQSSTILRTRAPRQRLD
jgi:hypothetical protein